MIRADSYVGCFSEALVSVKYIVLTGFLNLIISDSAFRR